MEDDVWVPISMNATVGDLAVDPKTNHLYVTTEDSRIFVIDGTKIIGNMTLKSPAEDIAVNPNTDAVYIVYPTEICSISKRSRSNKW